MLRFFYIGLGGALGALLRYVTSGIAHRLFYGGFPWGTIIVNGAGSFAIGVLWSFCESYVVSQNIRVFLFVGILGSFTTFSTFSLESFHLIRDGEYGYFFINILLSFLIGVGLVFAGYFLMRFIRDIMH